MHISGNLKPLSQMAFGVLGTMAQAQLNPALKKRKARGYDAMLRLSMATSTNAFLYL